jgi:hypothetical protein
MLNGTTTMVIDQTVATNIVSQLGSMLVSGQWSLERPPSDRMRGVDFYTATEFISALLIAAQMFRNAHGYMPNLVSPSSFSERLFVRKFFAALPMPSLADKLVSRDYVKARLGDGILPSIVWIGNNVNELLATELPAGRFVLKANHGWGCNLFLNLPGDLSSRRDEIEKLANGWLQRRYGYSSGEWQYCTFKPRLFLEEFLDFNAGNTPDGYKIYCFNGKARLISVHIDRFTRHKNALYDTSWNYIPMTWGCEIAQQQNRPDDLDDLIGVAERIAEGLEFARIDLYSDKNGVITFGEITFTPGDARDRFSDIQYDMWLGKFFETAAASPILS